MIYPTEMTLTTGTTVYAGDPDSDERIRSREVRVSVTFQIDEEADIDLAELACAKAAEVERARMAAQERIGSMERAGRDLKAPCGSSHSIPPCDDDFDPDGLEPPDEKSDESTGDAPDPFPQEADYLSDRSGHAGNGRTAVPAPPWIVPGRVDTAPATSNQATEAETDWATKPQVLALGSHFRRLGLSPQDQTALLRDRFGKFRPERLTRDEAATLMRSLERGEVAAERSEMSAERSEPGRDGRGTVTAIPSAH